MLIWKRIASDDSTATTDDRTGSTSAAGRDDLKIRSLLDDPALRRAMGLDVSAEVSIRAVSHPAAFAIAGDPAPQAAKPVRQRRFDRRRLLESAAA
jgi:hypothetical protein